MRDRYRAQVRDEVKRVALDQLAAGGPQAVSVNAIARELGVSGPALYRYVANRDALLTELVLDAYADLTTHLTTATAAGGVAAVARAYREWALAQPHRYRLLYATALPGFDPHAAGLVEAAQRAMDVLLRVVPDGPEPTGPLADQLAGWAAARGVAVSGPAALAAVLLWSRLHGLVSLEIDGNWASVGVDPALLLDAELAALSPRPAPGR